MSRPSPPHVPLASTPAPTGARRPYRPPRIEVVGEVYELTLGGSAGINDSGDPNTAYPGKSRNAPPPDQPR